MMVNRITDHQSISLEEAGNRIEINGPFGANARWWLTIIDVDDAVFAYDEPSFEAIITAMDAWIGKHVPIAERFAGFKVERWSHEENQVEVLEFRTRGDLLRLFDEGTNPTIPELIDLLECTGDRVLRVWTVRGELLLADRREMVQQQIERDRAIP